MQASSQPLGASLRHCRGGRSAGREHLQRGALDEENDAALGGAEAVPERELQGPGDCLPRRGALPHGGHLLQAAHHVVNWEPLALAGYVGDSDVAPSNRRQEDM
jgi:hypothetical protein